MDANFRLGMFVLLLYHAVHRFTKGKSKLLSINGEKGEIRLYHINTTYHIQVTIEPEKEATSDV